MVRFETKGDPSRLLNIVSASMSLPHRLDRLQRVGEAHCPTEVFMGLIPSRAFVPAAMSAREGLTEHPPPSCLSALPSTSATVRQADRDVRGGLTTADVIRSIR